MERKKEYVWLIGNKGMLGTQIENILKSAKIPYYASDKDVDITNINRIKSFLKDKIDKIFAIINCSAYTNVDKAEIEKDKAYAINAKGVKNICEIIKNYNIILIHFSTDYVFGSTYSSPIKENFKTSPNSIYGITKLQGENYIKEMLTNYFIFRISWLYGIYGKNFVKTIIKLIKTKDEISVVNDQIGSPTYAAILSTNILNLITKLIKNYENDIFNFKNLFGTYHYSDMGKIAWYGFAQKIMQFALKFELIEKPIKIKPINSYEYKTLAKRPSYSVLDKEKVEKKLNFIINSWEENLLSFFYEWKKFNFN